MITLFSTKIVTDPFSGLFKIGHFSGKRVVYNED